MKPDEDEPLVRDSPSWAGTPMLWAAVAFFALALGAAILTGGGQPDRPPSVGQEDYAARLQAIQAAWEARPRMKGGRCPLVRTLEGTLPELGTIDARERDYVAWLRGVRC